MKKRIRRKLNVNAQIAFITAFAIAISLLLLLVFDVKLTRADYRLESDKLSGGVRMLVLADLHSCRFGTEQCELINRIDTIKPDLIVMPGDIVDNIRPQTAACELLSNIAGRYPCYYVTGNHEIWTERSDDIKEMIAGYGVVVLEGECRATEINGCKINICGIDDTANRLEQRQLEAAFENIDTDIYTVLLAHRPERVDVYAQYPCDLVINGHAHGGQWRLPPVCNGVYAPNQGLFPKYAGGRYEHDAYVQIVSRGIAMNYTIPRIFNPPELTVIELAPENE